MSPDFATVKITQKAWKSQVHDFLKTDSGRREIDLHSSVAAMPKEYIGERKSGLLFCSKTGKPLQQSNILRRTLHPILAELNQPKCGAHAFRRFRLTWLRENAVPKDLEHFCMGHADQDRKSTRLNSSHGYISYAVYFLTKKISSWVLAVARWAHGQTRAGKVWLRVLGILGPWHPPRCRPFVTHVPWDRLSRVLRA